LNAGGLACAKPDAARAVAARGRAWRIRSLEHFQPVQAENALSSCLIA
jgi:hypothetical protein